MKVKRIRIVKLTGEVILIFISIMLAFLFENYRKSSNDKEDYLSALMSFRNDVHTNIIEFRKSYDPAYYVILPKSDSYRNLGKPYLMAIDSILTTAESLL